MRGCLLPALYHTSLRLLSYTLLLLPWNKRVTTTSISPTSSPSVILPARCRSWRNRRLCAGATATPASTTTTTTTLHPLAATVSTAATPTALLPAATSRSAAAAPSPTLGPMTPLARRGAVAAIDRPTPTNSRSPRPAAVVAADARAARLHTTPLSLSGRGGSRAGSARLRRLSAMRLPFRRIPARKGTARRGGAEMAP